MAEVAICSLVRDGMDYLPIYRRQIESLRLDENDSWRLYILEGDSQDGSQAFLNQWAQDDSRVSVGQEHVGEAAEQEDRAARWARAANACLDLIPQGSSHTHVLWLEADLCFPSELLKRLLSRQVDVIAPMIYLGGVFYDTWGFRDLSGCRWTNSAPFHPNYRPFTLLEMGSVGSCVLFRREILDAGIQFKGTYENGLLVGICQEARAKGYHVWADTATAILHPMEQWEAQMWRPRQVHIHTPDGLKITIPIPEAETMGLASNMPLLDPGTCLKAQRLFLKRLFNRLCTNRLEIELKARSYPRKSYEVIIRPLPPRGIARFTPFRRFLVRFFDPSRFLTNQAGKSHRPLNAWASKQFYCPITITFEEIQ